MGEAVEFNAKPSFYLLQVVPSLQLKQLLKQELHVSTFVAEEVL